MFKSIIHIVLLLVVICSVILFTGCEKTEPLGPITGIEKVEENSSNQAPFQILRFGDVNNSFEKVSSKSSWITVQRGGHAVLIHRGEENLRVFSKLSVRPNSISEDAEVSLTIDDQNFMGCVDVQLEPYGITFNKPAYLNILASGLDLSCIDPNSLDIFYLNEDTGEWERMERDGFLVFPNLGRILVINAKVHHFSRYAIGAE
jgi:hypothetical protein